MTIGEAMKRMDQATVAILKEYGYDPDSSERDSLVVFRVVMDVGEAFQRTLMSNASPEVK